MFCFIPKDKHPTGFIIFGMMKIGAKLIVLTTFYMFAPVRGKSQVTCKEDILLRQPRYSSILQQKERELYDFAKAHPFTKTNVVITIPMVIHIVWNTPSQNISTAQVLSQVNILNKDFRRLNADTINTPVPFKPIAADAQIQFCLAQRDPAGNPTTGITRTQTSVFSFSPLLGDTSIYYTSTGGEDAWDTSAYMNIWVCNNGGGMATWPGITNFFPGLQDGVIMDPLAFGDIGTVVYPTNKGRLCDHEVGHYFFLLHPWGYDTIYCSPDSVADTPPQKLPTLGCPSFPVLDSCSPNFPGITYNVYMDYTDDSCMNMFTIGQAARMNWCIQTFRSTLLSSLACVPPAGYGSYMKGIHFTVSPNPSSGYFYCYIELPSEQNCCLEIIDLLGNKIEEQNFYMKSGSVPIDLGTVEKGIYFLKLSSHGAISAKKILVR